MDQLPSGNVDQCQSLLGLTASSNERIIAGAIVDLAKWAKDATAELENVKSQLVKTEEKLNFVYTRAVMG
jgi:hypothetical protein